MMRALFAVTFLLSACVEEPPVLGPFAQASEDPEDLRAVLHAATGYKVEEYTTRVAKRYAMQNEPDGCPRVTTTGTTTTMVGDCYRNGDEILGSMVIENFWDTAHYDALRPSQVTAIGYGISTLETDGSVVLDGTYQLDSTRNSRDIALTMQGGYGRTETDLHLTCDGEMCTAAPGSTFRFSRNAQLAVYEGAVEGTWSNTAPFAGSITLRAADVITFDLSGQRDGCIPYELSDGSTGCLED